VDRQELNPRHRDFQSVQDDDEPVSPRLPQSLERVKKAYDDLRFSQRAPVVPVETG
jgi:hypothetical protein